MLNGLLTQAKMREQNIKGFGDVLSRYLSFTHFTCLCHPHP